MALRYRVVSAVIRGLGGVLCRVDDRDLSRVPSTGPLILVSNHVNFLDIPLVFTRLLPRPVTGFVKIETWENPWMAFLFNTWQAIPIRRGEADMTAIRQGLAALAAGRIVTIAPEGTRSGDGRLRQAHPGVVTLALHSQSPLLPLVFYGGEAFHPNFRRLRRTDVFIRVGRPFILKPDPGASPRQARQRMLEAIMGQLAALLPQQYRGVYADQAAASQSASVSPYLRFL